MAPTMYSLAKLCMYAVFVLRIKVVYGNSVFAYNTTMLSLLMAVIVVFSIMFIVASWLTVTPLHMESTCEARWPVGLTESQAFLDLLANVLCCYLFISPLRHLMRAQKEESTERREETYIILRKYCVLSLTAGISTFVMFTLLVIIRMEDIVSIDIVINCFCVMMFNKKHQKWERREDT